LLSKTVGFLGIGPSAFTATNPTRHRPSFKLAGKIKVFSKKARSEQLLPMLSFYEPARLQIGLWFWAEISDVWFCNQSSATSLKKVHIGSSCLEALFASKI